MYLLLFIVRNKEEKEMESDPSLSTSDFSIKKILYSETETLRKNCANELKFQMSNEKKRKWCKLRKSIVKYLSERLGKREDWAI